MVLDMDPYPIHFEFEYTCLYMGSILNGIGYGHYLIHFEFEYTSRYMGSILYGIGYGPPSHTF